MKTFKEYLTEETVNFSKDISMKDLKKYIGKDEVISVTGNVDLVDENLDEIPVKFDEVHGAFQITKNNLTTLKNCPKIVAGDFYINRNNLPTLKDGPISVGGDYICRANRLANLEGAPNHIMKSFKCSSNTALRSLKGCPEIVSDVFEASDCSIRVLDFLPKYAGTIDLSRNPFGSLISIHKKISKCKILKLNYISIKEGGIGLIMIEGLEKIETKGSFSRFVNAIVIISKYLGKGKKGLLACAEELEEAGLEAYAKL